MEVIARMLTGEMEMSEFISELRTNRQVQEYIRNIVPQEAKGNPDHHFWNKMSYNTLMKLDFDYLRFLYWIGRFDESIGDNLNISSILSRAYCYHHPEIICTNRYQNAYSLYLDIIKDCFDGPEVRHVTNNIIRRALVLKTKKQQVQQAKMEVEQVFHITDKKRPRWIQGPEWPMGAKSPMKFVSQKRIGECVEYLFTDVDAVNSRVVKQFY